MLHVVLFYQIEGVCNVMFRRNCFRDYKNDNQRSWVDRPLLKKIKINK
jgi:hypothetical protein